jgi:DNA-binding CsgD family transcriptional regulator
VVRAGRRLLGRSAQAELIRALARDAAAGRPGVLLVRGAEGTGKSALLAAVDQALRDEAAVLSAVCVDDGPFSVARALFGEAPADAEDEHGLQRRLLGLAAERAGALPLVILLDDVHRCDSATARWLGLLVRRAPGGRVLLVLASRCADRTTVDALFAEVAGAADTAAIDLGPLAEADVRELLRWEFGAEPHEEFLRACLELGNGIPGATLSCVARIAGRGGRPDEEQARRLRAETTPESAASWLASQGETVLRYATAVAIVGDDRADATGALFGLPVAAGHAARTTLRLAGVLSERGTVRSEPLRAHLLAAFDPQELAELRLRAARLLSDEGRPAREVAEQIAALPVVAEPWMADVLREAARECGDPAAAARYLSRALEVTPDHVGLRLQLANALDAADPKAAGSIYGEVLREVTAVEERAFAVTRQGAAALRTPHVTVAFANLVTEWRALPATADPELRVVMEVILLMVGLAGATTVAAALGHSREMAPPAGARTRFARRLAQQLGRAELLRGESVDRTLEMTRASLPPPDGIHDWWDTLAAKALHFGGRPDEAAAVADRVLAEAATRGDESSHAVTLAARASWRLDLGELEDAAADAEAVIAHPLGGAHTSAGRWARMVLASVCAHNADHAGAQAHLAELPQPREPELRALRLMAIARLHRGRGELDAALAALRACGDELDAMGIHNPVLVPWWLDAVAVLVELERRDEAADLASLGEAGAARWDTPPARGYAAFARGLVTGDGDLLANAARQLEAAGYLLHAARALTALGLTLARRGDDKAARRPLRTAVGLAVRCGAQVAADTARAALVRAGGRMSELSARDVLTGGERRVAELAARGRSNRQIADTRFVTVRTVESHLSNAYRKLGVQTRADLAARLR